MLQSPCVQQLQFSPFFNLNSTGERGRAREQGAAGEALCVFVQRAVKIGSNENTEFLSLPHYLKKKNKNPTEIFDKASLVEGQPVRGAAFTSPHPEDSRLSGDKGWPHGLRRCGRGW